MPSYELARNFKILLINVAPNINKLAPIQNVAPKFKKLAPIKDLAPKVDKMAPIQIVASKINKMAPKINKLAPIQCLPQYSLIQPNIAQNSPILPITAQYIQALEF